MALGQNILNSRKKSGLSQEQLGEKVNVTRQTISNWELEETAPNPDQLKLLSKALNVSVDDLIDNDIKDVLVEKTSNTEKLAGIILKLIKFMIVFIIVLPILLITLRIIFKNIHESNSGRLMNVSIECKLHDETYGYEFNYYETTGEIKEAGGDSYISNVVDISSDAYESLDKIDAYVKNNGGTCTKTDPKPVKDNN